MSAKSTPAHRPSLKTLPSIARVRGSSRPSIADLKLSNILNQETCPPISLNEFAQFIANREFTSENLLFVLWYRSYAHRWSLIPEEKRLKVPIPSTALGDHHAPFDYLDRRSSTAVELSSPVDGAQSKSNSAPIASGTSSDPSCRADDVPGGEYKEGLSARRWSLFKRHPSSIDSDPSDVELTRVSVRPLLPSHRIQFLPVDEQPMRQEAVRAFATFIKKSGIKELGISDDLRQYVKTCLARSSAPECFFPVYEDIYRAMESQSLPHFIESIRGNVNTPKAKFWYLVGGVNFLIGVIVFLLITLLVSDRRFAYRAIRLPSTVFVWFGVAQIYSAYREFCSQVWGRKATQLRPWELDMEDEENALDTTEPGPALPDLVASTSASTNSDFHRTDSAVSNGIITPSSACPDAALPEVVHPLSDFSGATLTGSSESLPWGKPVAYEDDGMMSEAARAQLSIRRDTLKVPDASLAFPINAGQDPPLNGAKPSVTVNTASSPRRYSSCASPAATEKPQESDDAADMELCGLLVSLHRKTAGKTIGEPKTFGPEKVVEDPRVQRLYESIVRDVTIVATVFSVIWVGICIAVPMAGLI